MCFIDVESQPEAAIKVEVDNPMRNDLSNIIVIGGSGGIGSALVNALLRRFPKATICATYHQSIPRLEHDQLEWQQLNVRDGAAIKILSERFERVDWLINCVGFLHKDGNGPEKKHSVR